MNIKTLFNRTALLLLLSISYSNFSAVAIGQTKSKLPSSSPKKTTQSYPDFRSDDYEHLRLIHFFQTISPNQTKTAEHLGLTAKEISEIHLGTQTQVASQAMKVLQNLEQKEKKLRVLRNSLQNDPPNRNVTHEIEHLEKEIRKSHIKLLLKAVDFIENRLSSIQFKRLDRLSYYRATLESFKHHGFLKVPIEENDRYLMWPAWIAESLELDDELIEKLLETGIQEEKRLLKKLDSEKNKQIFSTKKSKLSDIQKNALKRLVEQIESQQEGLKNIAITGLLFQLESSSQFELTPSQTSEGMSR